MSRTSLDAVEQIEGDVQDYIGLPHDDQHHGSFSPAPALVLPLVAALDDFGLPQDDQDPGGFSPALAPVLALL